MRILFLDENGEPVVMEAAAVTYDSDIFDVKAEDGSYDITKEMPVEGLWIEQAVTPSSCCLYIPNIRRSQCEEVIEELMTKGYVDLRGLGIAEYFDFDE